MTAACFSWWATKTEAVWVWVRWWLCTIRTGSAGPASHPRPTLLASHPRLSLDSGLSRSGAADLAPTVGGVSLGGVALTASAPPSLWNSVAFPVFPGPLPGTHHRYTQVPTWWTRLSFWRQAGEQKSSRAWPEVPGDPEAGPLSESLFSGMRARHQACKQYRALGKRSTPACCLCLLLPVPGIAHVWVRALLLRGWDCRGVTGSRSLTP